MPDERTVTLQRDCRARRVPYGDEVVLPAGSDVRITQELGGTFTVDAGGWLARIEGKDADALGRGAPAAPELPAEASDGDVERAVWQQLRTCYDPEIPINIVDLGLVYALQIVPTRSGKRHVRIAMTLTAPGCGMGPVLADDVRGKVEALAAVESVDVDVVFDPPWSPERMSEAARLQTGML